MTVFMWKSLVIVRIVRIVFVITLLWLGCGLLGGLLLFLLVLGLGIAGLGQRLFQDLENLLVCDLLG